MNDMRSLLKDADPVRLEPGLSDSDAARIRHLTVSSVGGTQPRRAFWFDALAVAAVLLLVVTAGTFAGRRLPTRESSLPSAAETAAGSPASERRQLQFATPGGTRIIWTLDPEFQLKGVVP